MEKKMIYKKIVLMNDQTNSKGVRFPVEALEDSLNQCWENGTPSCISHDYLNPFGWVEVEGILIDPKYSSLIGTLSIPENDADKEYITKNTSCYIQKNHFSIDEEIKDRLKNETKGLISDEAIFCDFGFYGVIDKNIVPKLFPYLFTETDKNDLIKYDQLKMIFPGVYEIGKMIIFAHQYFRRNYSRLNNLNVEFLDLFDKVSKKNNSLKIAIDLDMIGLKDSFKAPMEFEFWWGPKFNNSIKDIPKGVTQHVADDRLRFFHQVVKNEFFWYDQDNHHVLECEEIVDFEVSGQPFKYGCRYIHSMVDKETDNIIHLDGAIRGYSDEQMISRLDIDISKQDKSLNYLKLWRIDGSIELSVWKELICHFYRDNYLAGEYLSPELDDNTIEYLDNTKRIEKDIIGDMFFDKSPKSGYHAYVAYEDKEKYTNYKDEINILPDFIYFQNGILCITESILVEFKKLCRQKYIKLSTPIRHENIAFEDFVSNLPQLYFSGKNAIANANNILTVIEELIQILASDNEKRIFSFSLSIEYETKVIIFSFLGNVVDLSNLLPMIRNKIPSSETEVGSFIKLIQKSNSSIINFLPLNFINQKKSIFFNRKIISKDNYELKIDNKEIVAKIEDENIINYMKKFELDLTPVNLIIKSTCSRCGNIYNCCNCIKYKHGTAEEVNNMIHLGAVLTRHKA